MILSFSSTTLAEEKTPKCHIYIDQAGWNTLPNIKKMAKARYDSADICSNILKNYPCYSYFEEKDKCKSSDEGLIKLFIEDAQRDNKII